jgi:excisionase family DNA binding protein
MSPAKGKDRNAVDPEKDPLTVADVARILKVSCARVYVLCEQERIKATRFGPAWMIPRASLESFVRAPAGRPPKSGATEAQVAVQEAMKRFREANPA